MPGLVPGIHVFLTLPEESKAWMAGTSPAMTAESHRAISQVVITLPVLGSFPSFNEIFKSASFCRI
jgi:hypothetical protein